MQFTSILELIFAVLSSITSLTSFFGSRFSSFNEILERLPLEFLTPYGRKLVIRLLSAFFACIFWVLYFFSYRVEPLSPYGFAELTIATLAGPITVLFWSIDGLSSKQTIFKSRKGIWRRLFKRLFGWVIIKTKKRIWRRFLKWFVIKGPLILVAVVFGTGGLLGITYGVIRPLENNVVVTCVQGLEEMSFEDELLLNLEHLESVHGLVPKYYKGEVHDRPTAREIAYIKNQRFVVWGNVRIEKNEDYLATVLLRVTDATEDRDVFSSDGYIIVATSMTDIVSRVADDFTVLTMWSLGFANLGWQPTSDSVVGSSRIFAALSDKTLYENVFETKSLGLLLQDIGFLEMKKRLLQDKTTRLKAEEAFLTAIAELDPTTSKSALAKLHNYYAEFIIESGLDSKAMNQKIKRHLQEAIQLDNSYPMPHYNLVWISQAPGESNEDSAWHACEFIRKIEEIYGQLLVEDGDKETGYSGNLFNERIKFVEEFLSGRALICDTETHQIRPTD